MASMGCKRPQSEIKTKRSRGGVYNNIKMGDFMQVQIRKLTVLYPFLTADQIRKRAKDDWHKYQNSMKYRDKVKVAADIIRNSPRKQTQLPTDSTSDDRECVEKLKPEPAKENLSKLKFLSLDKVKMAVDVIKNSPRKRTDVLTISSSAENGESSASSSNPTELNSTFDFKSFTPPVNGKIESKPIAYASTSKLETPEKTDAFDELLRIPNSKTLVTITPIKSIKKQLWAINNDDEEEVYEANSSDSDISCELQIRQDSNYSSDSSRPSSPVRQEGGTVVDGKAKKRKRGRPKKGSNVVEKVISSQSSGGTGELISSMECGNALSNSTPESQKEKQRKNVELRRIAQPDSDFVRKALEVMNSNGDDQSGRRSSRLNHVNGTQKYPLREAKKPKNDLANKKPVTTKKSKHNAKRDQDVSKFIKASKKGSQKLLKKEKWKELSRKTDSESQEDDFSLFSETKKVKKKTNSKKGENPRNNQSKITQFYLKNGSPDTSRHSSPAPDIPGSDVDPNTEHLWTSDENSGVESGSIDLISKQKDIKTFPGRNVSKRKRKDDSSEEKKKVKWSKCRSDEASSSQGSSSQMKEGSSELTLPTSEQEVVVNSSQDSNSSVRRSNRSTAGSGLSAILNSLKSRSTNKSKDDFSCNNDAAADFFEIVDILDSEYDDRCPFNIDDVASSSEEGILQVD